MTSNGEVRSIFHVNINCTDLDRSVSFYTALGFRTVMDVGTVAGVADGSYAALGTSGPYEHRGPVVMFLGDDKFQTRLDLMQWMTPASVPVDPLRSNQTIGINRIALRAKGLRSLYERLSAAGFTFLTPPAGPFPDRVIESIVCLRDPDGLLVELMEFMPGGTALYRSDAAS